MTGRRALVCILTTLFLAACGGRDNATPATQIRIPRGAGGVGFLPLLMMEKHKLIEEHAAAAGLSDLKVEWIELGGPSAMNDAILSGGVDFIAAGPPAFLLLWDKTPESGKVKSVAAMTSLPMYLNVRGSKLNKLEDFTDTDKIAMTAIKASIPAIIMQMYAAEKYGLPEATRFDKFTVPMAHPDGVIALLSGSGIAGHFTSPPFHQRERKDSSVRTIMTSDDVMKGSTTFTMLSTTTTFRDRNPEAVAAVLAALEDATRMIRDDKKAAADVLLSSTTKSGFTPEELMEVIGDPKVKFTTTPENVMKYAEFMHSIGTIETLPASWKDLFFPEIHGAPGS